MDAKDTSDTDRPGALRDHPASVSELFAHGLYVLLPLVIIVLVARKLISMLQELLGPVLNRLPGVVLHRPSVRFLLLCFTVAAALVLIGLLARLRVCRAAGSWLESEVLNKVPFYSRLRSFSSVLAAKDGARAMKVARVTVDVPGLEQLGIILERHQDGSATVFLPSSPNASSGTVVIVEPDRIREVGLSAKSVVGCMGRFGYGTADLLSRTDQAARG
jgi:uncharacterized membrane protein